MMRMEISQLKSCFEGFKSKFELDEMKNKLNVQLTFLLIPLVGRVDQNTELFLQNVLDAVQASSNTADTSVKVYSELEYRNISNILGKLLPVYSTRIETQNVFTNNTFIISPDLAHLVLDRNSFNPSPSNLEDLLSSVGVDENRPLEAALQDARSILASKRTELKKYLMKTYPESEMKPTLALVDSIFSQLEDRSTDSIRSQFTKQKSRSWSNIVGTLQQQQFIPGSPRQEMMPGTSQQQQEIPGSSQQQQFIPGSSQQQQFIPGFSQQQQIIPGSSRQQQFIPGSSQQQQFVPGFSEQQKIIPESSQQQQFVPGSSRPQKSIPSLVDLEYFTQQNHPYITAVQETLATMLQDLDANIQDADNERFTSLNSLKTKDASRRYKEMAAILNFWKENIVEDTKEGIEASSSTIDVIVGNHNQAIGKLMQNFLSQSEERGDSNALVKHIINAFETQKQLVEVALNRYIVQTVDQLFNKRRAAVSTNITMALSSAEVDYEHLIVEITKTDVTNIFKMLLKRTMKSLYREVELSQNNGGVRSQVFELVDDDRIMDSPDNESDLTEWTRETNLTGWEHILPPVYVPPKNPTYINVNKE